MCKNKFSISERKVIHKNSTFKCRGKVYFVTNTSIQKETF